MDTRQAGCERCWPTDADAAWAARGALVHSEGLIDESHFRVVILACTACHQRFVSIFTETVDWADSEDPQHWVLLPVTAPEADDLIGQRPCVSEAQLNALGRGRRCLRRDYPKGEPPRVFWDESAHVRAHD